MSIHNPISPENDHHNSQSRQNQGQPNCPQCLRLNQLHHHHQCQQCQDQQESQEFIVPLKRIQMPATQNNITNAQLAELIKQVQFLKREHEKKDNTINELRNQIKQQKQFRLLNIINQQKQDIQVLKSQIQSLQSPKFTFMKQPKKISKQKLKPVRYASPDEYSQSNQFDHYQFSRKFENTQKSKSIKKQEKKYIKLEEDIHWMRNFIISFLEMIDRLSQQYGENIFLDRWTMKKKTKVGWRYLKHLIKFWLDQQ